MAAVTFHLGVKGLDDIQRKFGNPRAIRKPLFDFFTAAAQTVQGHARANAPAVTGKLRKRIKYTVSTRLMKATVYVAKVKGREQVPLWIERGTRAHAIGPAGQAQKGKTARRVKKLRKMGVTWTVRNKALKVPLVGGGFFAQVHHPGTRARPFMEPALGQSRGTIDSLSRKLERDVIHALENG